MAENWLYSYVGAMLSRSLRIFVVFSCSILFVSALSAQKYVPKKISFSGYAAATEAELLTVSGLQPGAALGQPEIQAAAQKLNDTGLFSDIRFSFNGDELHYVLKPMGGAEPVSYANFPWWDDKTLSAAVAARVPLFHGTVIPESGLQQQVTVALMAMVKEKGVEATVTGQPHRDPSGKDLGVEFEIASPAVQMSGVQFAGASAAWTETLAALQKAAVGQEFNEATQATLDMAVQAVYHRQGYLDVAMTGFTHGDPQVADEKIMVPVNITLREGEQYRFASVKLSGDVLMTPDEFAKRTKLRTGDVANEDQLRQTLAAVAGPYRSKGYLRAKIQAEPTFDRGQRTVDYAITVTPGAVFHMGKLTIGSLDEEKKALVLKYWTLHEGDVYDATYPPSFLSKNKSTLHALDSWSASYKQYENEETHIVDLVITFRTGGPLN